MSLRLPGHERAQRARRRLAATALRLRFVEEPEPRGTAGALKYAESLLDERFLMLNGDVLTDIDLTAQIAQHERDRRDRHARARPGRRPDAPTGSCASHEDRSVREFVEKPSADQIDTNLIRAGAYVLERAVLDLIPPDRNVSIEREIWPRLVGDGPVRLPDRRLLARHRHARALPAGDLRHPRGQRADRRARAARARLPGRRRRRRVDGRVVPPAVVERGCRIGAGAHVGSLVVLGDGVTVGAGRDDRALRRAATAPRSAPAACCSDCIVAAGRAHRRAARSSRGGAVLGEGVTVGADNVLTAGVRVFPGTELPDGAIKF